MKDGQEKQPLEERLRQKTEAAKSRQDDLMASASQSFKADLEDMLTAAKNTIKAGIQDHQSHTQKMIDSVIYSYKLKETEALGKLEQEMNSINLRLLQMKEEMSMRNHWATLILGLALGLSLGFILTLLLIPDPAPVIIPQQPQTKPPIAEPAKITLPGPYVVQNIEIGKKWSCDLKENQMLWNCKEMDY